jgi:hypothetical protein
MGRPCHKGFVTWDSMMTRSLAPPEPVTLEQLMHLIVAMLAHGWGSLEVSIVNHELHAVKPHVALRTSAEIDNFVLGLTQPQ